VFAPLSCSLSSNWWRQMPVLPESGSAGGPLLLKSPLLSHTCSGQGPNQRFEAICSFFICIYIYKHDYTELQCDGLTWTALDRITLYCIYSYLN